MSSTTSRFAKLVALGLLACASAVNSHTWVEELRLIASNGSYVGAPGYPRGYVPESDATNVYELPPDGSGRNAFLPTDLMCKSSQTVGTQAPGFSALVAAPQDHVALRYKENGHVTQPGVPPGRPLGRGTVFVYGTTQPANTDTYLGIHRVWNTDGTGGDKRGKLIATQPFDDGRCFQNNNGNAISTARMAAIGGWPSAADLLCQTDVQIPSDASNSTSGQYTLYWVWEWPLLFSNGALASNQSYTSCMDIKLTSNPVADAGKFNTNGITGLAAQSVAVEAEYSTAYMVKPTALPQVALDAVGAAAPPGVQPPTAAPAATGTSSPASAAPMAPTSSSTPISSTPKLSSSSPAASISAHAPVPVPAAGADNFVTVTVYETQTVTASASPKPQSTTSLSTTSTSTMSVIKTTTITSSSVGAVNGGASAAAAPVPSPFLNGSGGTVNGMVGSPVLRVRGRVVG